MAIQSPKTYSLPRCRAFLVWKSQNRLYCCQPEMSWKCAWKISVGDLIYRICLSDYGLIPNPLSDDPSSWDCWLTDLVKCAHADRKWKDLKKNHKAEDILKESAEILQRELEIIHPENVIIVGKTGTEKLFKKYMATWIAKNGKPRSISHYPRAKTLDAREPGFVKDFNDVMKQINRARVIS